MTRWLRRARAALATGVLWALAWAPVAVLAGLVIDPDNSMDEMWPMIGALPGFIGGVLFSVVLGVVARRRRFEELSVGRFAQWGGAAGFAVGVIPFLIGEPAPGSRWLLGGVVIGSFTVMSAASAAGSLALARRAERRALPGAPADRVAYPGTPADRVAGPGARSRHPEEAR